MGLALGKRWDESHLPTVLYFVPSGTYMHAYGALLGNCKSSVCTSNRGPLFPLHSRFVRFFLVSERREFESRPRSEAPCTCTFLSCRLASTACSCCCAFFCIGYGGFLCAALNCDTTINKVFLPTNDPRHIYNTMNFRRVVILDVNTWVAHASLESFGDEFMLDCSVPVAG